MTGKSTSLLWTLLLISLAALPPFAAGQRSPRDYFPLKSGAVYKFEVDSNDPRRYVTQSVEWQILPSRELNGTTVFPRKHITPNGYSLFTFFGVDGSGIYVAAYQNPDMEQPKVWAHPQYILKSPLQAGARWAGEMYAPGAKNLLPYTSVVESTTEIVTVPAGTFKDCARIRTTGSNENSTVKDLWFYAPGVGSIKFLREEVTGTGTNSRVAAQLSFFSP